MRPVWFLGRELTISAALSWFVLVLLVVTIVIPGLPYATLDLVLSSINSVGLTVAAIAFERGQHRMERKP